MVISVWEKKEMAKVETYNMRVTKSTHCEL